MIEEIGDVEKLAVLILLIIIAETILRLCDKAKESIKDESGR